MNPVRNIGFICSKLVTMIFFRADAFLQQAISSTEMVLSSSRIH